MEGCGVISYALSGLDTALPDEWEIVPIIKVGADVADQAAEFLAGLTRVSPEAALVRVPEPNNRSELRYFTQEKRSEFLSGGTPGWTWPELESLLNSAKLDALYVNFLSGWELDLATAKKMRKHFSGAIYTDLHMLLWKAQPSGLRELKPLADAEEWFQCFDFLQVNEDEMAVLASSPQDLAEKADRNGIACTVVTLGGRGLVYFASPEFHRMSDLDEARKHISAGKLKSEIVPAGSMHEGPRVDPTGCGDVWGSTFFSRLLAGDEFLTAIARANRSAECNVEYHGANGLAAYISEELNLRNV
jgi:hypothetical protein